MAPFSAKLHSRIAVAAVIAPLALLATACGDDDGDTSANDNTSDTATTASSEPTPSAPGTTDPTTAPPADPGGVDYVLKGVWHQADGDTVELPEASYDGAVIWNDQLVATRFDGEVYSVADVIADDGTVVDSFETTQPPVVNAAGTTIAWIDPDSGDVMTRWDGDQVSMGTVDLSAPGETVAYWTTAVTGGPNCYEDVDGCIVWVVGGTGEVRSFDSHGTNDSPLAQFMWVRDVHDGVATVLTEVTDDNSCSALVDTSRGRTQTETCEHQLWQISPDGTAIAAPPSYFDGLGPTSVSIVDRDGNETGTFAPEGGFVGSWAWTTDNRLVFDTYDGANWHLMTMTPDGELTEVGEPVEAKELDSPFTLIQH